MDWIQHHTIVDFIWGIAEEIPAKVAAEQANVKYLRRLRAAHAGASRRVRRAE